MERSIDANGYFLLPGLIDLHSDAIEKLLEPRPNIHFDLPIALHEADWRLAGCGITTEFHAVSLDDDEFGVRSHQFVEELARTIREDTSTLVRHKVHARFELTSQRGFEVVSTMIAAQEVNLVSLMDHSPGKGQFITEQAFREYVGRTAHKSAAELDALIALKRGQAAAIPWRIEQVTSLARQADLAIATHDDYLPEEIEQWVELGITLIEFPTTLEAARRAHELGLAVCMGAPNVLRGKSSGGNLSALVAIQEEIADVLCADYFPAALLGAVFKLATTNILTLHQATRLVTLNPARAVGLADAFGSIEPGKIADLIIVSLTQQYYPKVQRVFVDGTERIGRLERV